MSMWGFWWIFPLIGMVACVVFLALAFRAMNPGDMCMGRHRGVDDERTAALQREIDHLREEIERLRAARPGTTA
jgi:hypothetical protein